MGMMGMWADHAQTYLLVITTITFFTFSLLLFFAPLRWATLLQWRVPSDTDLTNYFGRCLGSFALVTNAMFLYAGLTGIGVTTMLEFFIVFCGLMVVVHIWGAIEGSQPIIETLEIGFWALLLVLNVLFIPSQNVFN